MLAPTLSLQKSRQSDHEVEFVLDSSYSQNSLARIRVSTAKILRSILLFRELFFQRLHWRLHGGLWFPDAIQGLKIMLTVQLKMTYPLLSSLQTVLDPRMETLDPPCSPPQALDHSVLDLWGNINCWFWQPMNVTTRLNSMSAPSPAFFLLSTSSTKALSTLTSLY